MAGQQIQHTTTNYYFQLFNWPYFQELRGLSQIPKTEDNCSSFYQQNQQ